MTTAKKQPSTTVAPVPPTAPAPAPATTRKAWIPKTSVDVVLEQIGKQEKRVAEMQKELDQEKLLLVKLAKAKAALEG